MEGYFRIVSPASPECIEDKPRANIQGLTPFFSLPPRRHAQLAGGGPPAGLLSEGVTPMQYLN